MRILLIATAYNGLTQRAHLELSAMGHHVSIELAVSDDGLRDGVALFQPDLIICPFLKDKIPEDIWIAQTCIVIHPGIKGDRGPSSMDWAILEDASEWGVTAVQASAVMDVGNIWASELFKRRPTNKSRMYRHEITEAAMKAIRDTVKRFASGVYFPEVLDYTNPDVNGRLRPVMTQKDRRIDWKVDDVETIIRKISAADNQPGVLDTIFGEDYYLYGACREGRLLGNPGEVIGKRQDAICRAAINGAVWISYLRSKGDGTGKHFKLPATVVLKQQLGQVPDYPAQHINNSGSMKSFFDNICMGSATTYSEIWYHEEHDVGYLAFDFYNGAMSTEKCHRLRHALISARQRPTKVIVLSCGMDFWSNGIDLNVIEAADDAAEEAWRNINAINDLVHEIITSKSHFVISAMLGNAAAGGLMMALAADQIYVRDGVVLNPHYKSMGLSGSEYWTYLLPRRVGQKKAIQFTEACLPIDTEQAHDSLLVDGIIYSDGYDFYRHVAQIAEHIAHGPDFELRLRLKEEQLEVDESRKPLDAYRAEELGEMKRCFWDPNHIYPQCGVNFDKARKNFVHKVRPLMTPPRLAIHRRITDTDSKSNRLTSPGRA